MAEPYRLLNETELEDDLRQYLKARFVQFELTGAKFTGADDTGKAIGVRYHIKVDGYAQRTGKRLFLRSEQSGRELTMEEELKTEGMMLSVNR